MYASSFCVAAVSVRKQENKVPHSMTHFLEDVQDVHAACLCFYVLMCFIFHYNACAYTFSCAYSSSIVPALVRSHALHLPLQCLRFYVLMCLIFQYNACACTFSCASSFSTMNALVRLCVFNLALPVCCVLCSSGAHCFALLFLRCTFSYASHPELQSVFSSA